MKPVFKHQGRRAATGALLAFAAAGLAAVAQPPPGAEGEAGPPSSPPAPAPAAVSPAPPAPAAAGALPPASGPDQMALLNDTREVVMGDVLSLQIIEDRDPPVKLYVSSRLEVEHELFGPLAVGGMTCRKIALEIKRQVEVDYYHRATVILKHENPVGSFGSAGVYGYVNSPGEVLIPTARILTLSEAIVQRGGFAPGADGSAVQVERRDPSGPDGTETRVVDVTQILATGERSADLTLRADDLVVVPPASGGASGFLLVIGAVNDPGYKELPARPLTVSQAIGILAGGFNKWAKRREVRLIRGDASLPEAEREVRVDVVKIFDGDKEGDPLVRPGDTIKVKEGIFGGS